MFDLFLCFASGLPVFQTIKNRGGQETFSPAPSSLPHSNQPSLASKSLSPRPQLSPTLERLQSSYFYSFLLLSPQAKVDLHRKCCPIFQRVGKNISLHAVE